MIYLFLILLTFDTFFNSIHLVNFKLKNFKINEFSESFEINDLKSKINQIFLNNIETNEKIKLLDPSNMQENFDPYWYLNKFGYLKTKKYNFNTKMSSNLVLIPSILEDGPHSSTSMYKTTREEITNAIKRFQKFARLKETGKIDQVTLTMMKTPRCGHPDLLTDDNKYDSNEINFLEDNHIVNTRKKRYALQGSKWSKNELKFKIEKYPKSSIMEKNIVDKELSRALKLWSDVSDIKFDQIKDRNLRELLILRSKTGNLEKIDINIRFETGYHGDYLIQRL